MKKNLFISLFLSIQLYGGSSQSTLNQPVNTNGYEDDDAMSENYDYESESEASPPPAIQAPLMKQTHAAVDTHLASERERIIVNVPVTMHVNNSPQTNTSQTFAPQNIVQARSESQAITITKHWQQLTNYVQPLKEEISKLSRRWYQLVERWPRYAVGSIYGSLFYIIVKSNYAMNNPSAWSQWKNHMSLQELQRYPQTELQTDLLAEIQNRYVNKLNPTDSITPLTQFITKLEEERWVIERYIIITSWISHLWLKKIFPFNSEKVEQANRAEQRLTFINHIFISWAANHNITKIT